jgi:hypothetical protein
MNPGIVVVRPQDKGIEFLYGRIREHRIMQLGRAVLLLEEKPKGMLGRFHWNPVIIPLNANTAINLKSGTSIR